MADKSQMLREVEEIPLAVARLAMDGPQAHLKDLGARLRQLDPPAVLTVARGSSDHAAHYLKYAIELALGRPVASIGPSVASIYGAEMRVSGLAALAISQSGASPDIVATAEMLGRGGAHVIALTNTADSALSKASHTVLDLHAGPERSVAATKSYVNSVVAGLWAIAEWAAETEMRKELRELPGKIDVTPPVAMSDFLGAVKDGGQAVIIARGPGLGAAQEMALKLIETCGVPATAYSAAEILHGPRALLGKGCPVLALADGPGVAPTVSALKEQGAQVFPCNTQHPTGHRLVDPILSLPPFYAGAEALSRALGRDPDAPPNLTKVTATS